MNSNDMSFGMLLGGLHRARHTAVAAALAAGGLQDIGSPMILFGIKCRGQEGELPVQRELSDTFRISPASVAVSLKSLERGGYIERRGDEKDARRKRIAITPKGELALETCRQAFCAVDERMFSGFSPEEREAVRAYCHRMTDNLHKGCTAPRDGCEGRRHAL